MAIVSRRLVFDQVAIRLTGVTNAMGYYGRIGRALTDPAPGGWVADPPVKSADDPRVKPYFVLYPGPGVDGPDAPLNGVDEALGLDWQVTAAGGDIDDVLGLVDRIDTLLLGWIPTLAGVGFGQVGRLPGTRPPLLPDRTVTPERLFVPLQYALTATH